MKKILTFFILALFFAYSTTSCHKYSTIQSDVNDTLYIQGRLFIQDSINGNGVPNPILATTTVYLSYASDLSHNIHTTQTDANGYFSFANLTKNTDYAIYAEASTGTGDFNVLFSITDMVSLKESSILTETPTLLLDNVKQNGVLYTIRNNISKGLIGGCSVCFFTDTTNFYKDSCEYSSFSIVSNSNGIVIKKNLLPNVKYYVLFKKTVGSSILKNKDVIIVTNQGIIRQPISL